MIIGLSGLIGSGKGAVSDILVNDYGYTKMAFADSLKDATAAIFSWPRHLLEGDTEESRTFREAVDEYWSKELGREITPRYILQFMGTEVMRDTVSQDIWIQSLKIRIARSNLENIVIPDVRFKNEFEFVRQIKGTNIRVRRGPEPEWYYTAKMVNQYGESEQYSMKKYSHVHMSEWASVGEITNSIIPNDGNLDDLKRTLSGVMSWL